jgi:hypothetical protein
MHPPFVQQRTKIKYRFGIKKFVFSVILGSSLVVAHIMATRGLQGR